jgi:hypothetical protein
MIILFKIIFFIELFQILWHKEVILQIKMEQEVNQFMGKNLKMKILK